jgi:SAM-dependent MidA family methyltransferase
MKPSTADARPEILAALRARAGGTDRVGFDTFMEVSLYHPVLGYYRADRPRVGTEAGTDFFTSALSAPLFGRLVAAACQDLLGHRPAAQHEFVEIGAEPGDSVLAGVDHPFASVRQLRVGEPVRITRPSVVFSNELFDAQPFRRFRYREGFWRELGVRLGDGVLEEAEIDPTAPLPDLPNEPLEGYVVDAPLRAAALAGSLAAEPWTGLFLAFDYGKSWEQLAHAAPEGTARSYRRHQQGSDLLAHAGDQDLTCHVCWDWISGALSSGGFSGPRLESQEAFFMRHSAPLIEAITTSSPAGMSPEKRSLLQLLHPAHMGQKFQAIWALRD